MPKPSTVGAYLVAHRETRGLSVEEVAAGTRIAPRIVRALEADLVDDLLSPVYVRGFIRAYCEAVGSPSDQALALYDEAVQDQKSAAALSAPTTGALAAPRTPRRTLEPEGRRGAARVAIGLTAVLLVAGALYPLGAGWLAGSRRGGDPGQGSVPPITAALTPSPAEVATEVAAEVATEVATEVDGGPGVARRPGRTDPTTGATAGPLRTLVMRANETTWIRVQPEHEPVWVETLEPGAVREWRSAGHFRVTLGNAGGVRLELDGQALPVLGTRGQVVRDVVLPAKAESEP
jgi:cytoskeleton protein RodZ